MSDQYDILHIVEREPLGDEFVPFIAIPRKVMELLVLWPENHQVMLDMFEFSSETHASGFAMLFLFEWLQLVPGVHRYRNYRDLVLVEYDKQESVDVIEIAQWLYDVHTSFSMN